MIIWFLWLIDRPVGAVAWIGMKFGTVEEAYKYYCDYAHEVGFSVRKMYEKVRKKRG